MATVKLVPSHYDLSNTNYCQVSNAANMYNAVDNTTFATLRGRTRSTTTYYCFVNGFDFSQVPGGATVNSFVIRIKAYRSQYQSTGSNYRIRLASAASSSRAISLTTLSTDLTTSVNTYTIPTGNLTWNDLVTYGSAFSIEIPLRNSSTASGRYPYVYVYGIEIEVDYTPATSGPDIYSNYYIRRVNGGWNPCVEGNNDYGLLPFAGSVLPNCSGFATGRYNELLNLNACTYLGNADGGNFMNFAIAQNLPTGSAPVVGGAMVWKNNGEGHVAIVEQIISATEIICSESGWYWTTPPVWKYVTHYYNGGRWHGNSAYIYQGCIYPPGTPGTLNLDGYYITFIEDE